ncbi:hypothetical protein SLS58_007791 [Diplodia intermedia]|uniref:NAD(P)-binding protein n=1 Tax=Diplodia intermedia TaxID=856260 RepID=A0ABR3TJ80_9PEZI
MPPVPLSPALSSEDVNKPTPAENLKGKNALITGGASGIGLAIGTVFAEKGAYVTLVDYNEEGGNQHAKDLQARGLNVQFIKADTRSWQSQVSAFKAAIRFHPAQTLDTVVAGAGNFSETFITPEEQGLSSLDETPAEPATVAWETNAIGTAFTAKLAQLYFELPPPPGGTVGRSSAPTDEPKSLILIASLAAYVDIPFMAAYTSSKYGVRGLFRSIRTIFAGRGHRVNLMAPWAIPTPMTAEWIPMFRAVGAAEGNMGQAVSAALRFAADPDVNEIRE